MTRLEDSERRHEGWLQDHEKRIHDLEAGPAGSYKKPTATMGRDVFSQGPVHVGELAADKRRIAIGTLLAAHAIADDNGVGSTRDLKDAAVFDAIDVLICKALRVLGESL